METHPSSLLPLYSSLAESALGPDFHFEFSRYVYIPQEISEKREKFRAPRIAAENLWQGEKEKLRPREEIAFHSVISSPSDYRHIPFLDMGCTKIEDHLPELKKAFRDFEVPAFTVFFSGRSYHIYGHGLLKDTATLIKFMGRLLLLNLPNQERVIDERWVGHRLMAGYLTLRWTNNNPHYKSAPKFYLVEKS